MLSSERFETEVYRCSDRPELSVVVLKEKKNLFWLHSLGGHSLYQALKETTLCTGLVKNYTKSIGESYVSKTVLKCLAPDTRWVSKAICMDGSQAMSRQSSRGFVPAANFDEVT